jgi:hypothetical protein
MPTIIRTAAGNWSDTTKWNPPRLPVPGDTIDLAGYLPTFDIDLPPVTNVLETDTVNGVAGTYHPPTVAEVQEGVAFGPSSSLTGTYGTDATGDGSMFGDALTAILNSDLGHSASYTTSGGVATSIRVLFHRDYAPELGIEGHHIWIEALTADVSAAKPRETITVDGTTYKIKSPPEKEDDKMSIIELSID